MGGDLNASEDAMPFAQFDWHWGLRYLRGEVDAEMGADFDAALEKHLSDRPAVQPWGWKHPHSYLLLPFLRERLPRMRFIHVVRDGRAVALSTNQQQAEHYGPLLGRAEEPSTIRSAAWWAWANTQAKTNGEQLGDDYLLARYEDLCADPISATRRLLDFAEGEGQSLSTEIVPSKSPERWRTADRGLMREIEVACATALRLFDYPVTDQVTDV